MSQRLYWNAFYSGLYQGTLSGSDSTDVRQGAFPVVQPRQEPTNLCVFTKLFHSFIFFKLEFDPAYFW